jgi:hypothetical protein
LRLLRRLRLPVLIIPNTCTRGSRLGAGLGKAWLLGGVLAVHRAGVGIQSVTRGGGGGKTV